jgi:WD40 repeat protein/tRNA A-37 threonylcarbamoyl transferase component Bud32
MGEVWRVYDTVLDRTLAMKVLRHELADQPDLAARFLREAQLTAGLEHPGVPPVHSLGHLDDGRPYYTMKELAGRTLAEELRDPQVPTLRLLGWLAEVAETLAFAHASGIIHRDVKPDNVLIGANGEVTLLDWGLARHVDAAETAGLSPATRRRHIYGTQAGTVVGTPGYMAPEQLRGEAVGPPADVFALGVTLRAIVLREVNPPWSADPAEGLGGELGELARMALQEDPRQRLPDAGGFRTRLQVWLDGERALVHARARVTRAEALLDGMDPEDLQVALEILLRLADPTGRSRTQDLAALRPLHSRSAALIAALESAGAVVVDQGRVGWTDPVLPSRWPRLSQALADDRRGLLLRDRIGRAAQDWETAGAGAEGLWQGALLREALGWLADASPLLTPAEAGFLQAARVADLRHERRRTRGAWAAVGVTAGVILTLAGAWFQASEASLLEQRMRIAAEGREMLALGREAERVGHPHEALAFYLAAAELGAVDAQDAATRIAALGISSRVIPVAHGGVWTVAHATDGRSVWAAGADGWVRQIDVEHGTIQRSLGPHPLDVRDIIVRPEGLWAWGPFAGIRVWDTAQGTPRGSLDIDARSGDGVIEVADNLLVATDRQRRVRVWDLARGEGGEVVGEARLEDRAVHHAAIGSHLAVQDASGRGYIFRLPGLEEIWAGYPAGTAGVASAGQDFLFFSNVGAWIRVGPLTSTPTIQARGDWVRRLLAVWRGGTHIFVAEPGGLLGFLNAEVISQGYEACVGPFRGHTGDVQDAISHARGTLHTSAAAEEVIVWAEGERRVVLEGHLGPIHAARWTADEQQLATASMDGTVRLWTAAWRDDGWTWKEDALAQDAMFKDDSILVEDITFADDGTGLAWCARAGSCAALVHGQRLELPFQSRALSVHAGHVVSRTREATLRVDGPGGAIDNVGPLAVRSCAGAGSPLRVACVTPEGVAHRWTERGIGVEPSVFDTRADVRYVRLSPEQDRMVVLSGGHEASLWQISTGTLVASLPQPTQPLQPSQIRIAHHTGELLVAANEGGALRFSLSDGAQLPSIAEGSGRWNNLAVSPDGGLLAAGTYDRTVRLYALPGGEALLRAGPFPGLPTEIALSPRGTWLAVYDDQGELRVWDVRTRQIVRHVHPGIGPGAWRSVGFRDETTVVAGYPGHWGIWRLDKPAPDPHTLTNLRVCRATATTIPIVPFPTDRSPWAPEEACGR